MYAEIDNKENLPKLEREILKFWKHEKIFEQSLELHQKELVFYDGPPFPTGNPHHGTIFVSILKDSIARFFTMNGNRVSRRWGWDCHGLPIEHAVEKKLGIKYKIEIEKKVGIGKFNSECRKLVSNANDSWETYIDKIGRWAEYHHPFRTMDVDFMESVLWAFKACYGKGLIYKDYQVTPYCCHCETGLSIADTGESDSTRPRRDPALVVRFKANESVGGLPTYYLAWTTAPWTLTSNLALAVDESFDYCAVEHEGAALIMAESSICRYNKTFGEEPKILARMKGEDLINKTYEPILPYFNNAAADGCFRILGGNFVSADYGVGIVHLAPAFGEEEFLLCRRNGIDVRDPVNASGRFTEEVPDFEGVYVLDTNSDIIKILEHQDKVVERSIIEHNYAHCWRCRSPLIYRAMDAWYFDVEKIKDKLIQNNEEINWLPSSAKYNHFGKVLAGTNVWNISRARFWGTPIPVWECRNCDHKEVLGSLADIENKTGTRPVGLHREYLDELSISCKKCSGTMARVKEVLSPWFESGSMPYAQCHYPFENKNWFEAHFPADFIVEYPGQFSGWFYYLHALSTALFDRPAFKNCVVHGTLLAADGSKISKSKKNYTDPMELIDTYGADAMRVYLLSSPAVAMADMTFNDEGIGDHTRDVLLPLMNIHSIFITYANINKFTGDEQNIPCSDNILDQWIMACLYRCEKEVSDAFSTYQLNKSLNPVLIFLESVTNLYIRQSRARFQNLSMDEDNKAAHETLFYVLISLTKLLAPSAPFITEAIYKNLTDGESVHLRPWPTIDDGFANEALIRQFKLARELKLQ